MPPCPTGVEIAVMVSLRNILLVYRDQRPVVSLPPLLFHLCSFPEQAMARKHLECD
jgi:hypothetical protein